MNVSNKLSEKYAVILPPPPEDYKLREKFKVKPEKENRNLIELLHKIKVWEDLTPVESVEEMLPITVKDMEDLGTSPAHMIPADAKTIPAPKMARNYSKNELVKLCDVFYDLATS